METACASQLRIKRTVANTRVDSAAIRQGTGLRKKFPYDCGVLSDVEALGPPCELWDFIVVSPSDVTVAIAMAILSVIHENASSDVCSRQVETVWPCVPRRGTGHPGDRHRGGTRAVSEAVYVNDLLRAVMRAFRVQVAVVELMRPMYPWTAPG